MSKISVCCPHWADPADPQAALTLARWQALLTSSGQPALVWDITTESFGLHLGHASDREALNTKFPQSLQVTPSKSIVAVVPLDPPVSAAGAVSALGEACPWTWVHIVFVFLSMTVQSEPQCCGHRKTRLEMGWPAL